MSYGDFDRALPVILEEEGGYYEGSHPWDPNPTMRGVTKATYDAYRHAKGQLAQSVQRISDAEVGDIYLTEYWIPSHAESLPWPLSLFHFDLAVNAGAAEAITVLQRTINRVTSLTLVEDGVWGPATESAVAQGFPLPAAPLRMLLERLFAYEAIVQRNPLKATPLVREWIPRVKDLARRYT